MTYVAVAALATFMASAVLVVASLASGLLIRSRDARELSGREVVRSRPWLAFDWLLVRSRPALVRLCATSLAVTALLLLIRQLST